jgi:hypothetical protein
VSSSNRPSNGPSSARARGARRPDGKSRQPAAPTRATVAGRKTTDVAERGRSSPPAGALRAAEARLPASARSRLTIKPGAVPAPRTQLQLSSKRRPAGPRLLSQVELDEDEVLIDAFDATLDGVRVRITAVLERTCVYVDRDGDRRLARKNDLWVEADKLPIRRRSTV